MTSSLLCNSTGVSLDVVKGKALVVMRGECDFSKKALVAQSLGATTLLLASNTTLVGHFNNCFVLCHYFCIKISVALAT